MEVIIDVFVENRTNGEQTSSNQAIYTFVAVDQFGAPIQVPELNPETEEEQNRHFARMAMERQRLIH